MRRLRLVVSRRGGRVGEESASQETGNEDAHGGISSRDIG